MIDQNILDMINEQRLISALSDEIYGIIDEEMLKGDQMNCELIDSLVDALEILQEENTERVFGMIPFIIDARKIKNKATRYQNFMKFTAVAASVALIFSGVNSVLVNTKSTSLISELAAFFENIREIFNLEAPNEDPNVSFDAPEEVTKPESHENNEDITEKAEDTAPDTPVQNVYVGLKPPTPSEEETDSCETATSNGIPVADKEADTSDKYEKLELVTDETFKRNYLWGEELDLTGLTIYHVKENGTVREEIPVKNAHITGFNGKKVGEQIITVEYEGLSASFRVTVSKTELHDSESRKITGAEFLRKEMFAPCDRENPATYWYVDAPQPYDNANSYRYIYSDGTLSNWNSAYNLTLVSELDRENVSTPQDVIYKTPEDIELTLSVQLFDTKIRRSDKKVRKIELYCTPAELCPSYFSSKNCIYEGDDCNFGDYGFYVYYRTKVSENSYTDSGCELIRLRQNFFGIYGDLSTNTPGVHTVTITYGDRLTFITFTVIERQADILSYRFTEKVWNSFYVNDPTKDPDELTYLQKLDLAPDNYPRTDELVEGYLKGNETSIPLDVEVFGYDKTKIGPITLDVYYKGKYLGTTTVGYIYGDSGYAMGHPKQIYYTSDETPNITPILYLHKIVNRDNNVYETYDMFKKDPKNSAYFPDGQSQSRTVTIYDYEGFDKVVIGPSTRNLVRYCINGPTLREFGVHEITATAYDYDNLTDGKPTEYTFTYTVEIRKMPVDICVEIPDNFVFNRDELQSELYEKIKVYEIYSDGTRVLSDNYYTYLNLLKGDDSFGKYSITVSTHISDMNFTAQSEEFYICDDGLENSCYISVRNMGQPYLQGYYSLNDENPSLYIDFYAGSTVISSTVDECKIEYRNFDTSTVGEHTATVVYTNKFGTFTRDFTYTVVEKIITPYIVIEWKDDLENIYASRFNGINPEYYDIYLYDWQGRKSLLCKDDCKITQTKYSDYTDIVAVYRYDVTGSSYSARGRIQNYGTLKNPAVFQDEETGRFGVKCDLTGPLEEGMTYDVELMIYDVKGIQLMGQYIGYQKESNVSEFLIDEDLLDIYRTQFFVIVRVTTHSPDGNKDLISVSDKTIYYNIFE